MNQRLVDELQLLLPVQAIEEFDLLRGGFESAGALAGNACGVDEVLVKAELRVQAVLGHLGHGDHQSDEPRLEHLHPLRRQPGGMARSEEHKSERQSLRRNSYADIGLKNNNNTQP